MNKTAQLLEYAEQVKVPTSPAWMQGRTGACSF